MRRPLLGLPLAAAAFAATFAAPASAGLYCEGVGPVQGFGPVCTVRCAASLRPSVDPSRVPPLTGTSAPCLWED